MSAQNIFIDGPLGKLEAILSIPNGFQPRIKHGAEVDTGLKGEGYISEKNLGTSPRRQGSREDNLEYVGIVCHPHPLYQGTMNNKVVVTAARAFVECGAPAIRFNFRGVGNSAGTYGQIAGEIEDLATVIDWVKQTQHPKGIWLAGFSFGSYISAAFAAQTQDPLITRLISLAPPVNHFPFAALPAPSCPWLVIYADKDEITPVPLVETWGATLPARAKLIEFTDCTHFFHGHLVDLKRVIEDWL